MRRTLALLATFLAIAIVTLLAPSPPNNANLNGQTVISVGQLNIPLAPADVGVAQAINNNTEYAVVEVATANMGARADFALMSKTPNQATGGAHSARNAPMTAGFVSFSKDAAEPKVNAASVNIRA